MSGIETTGSKRLVLVSGRAHPALAAEIAEELGSELVPTDARTFANGEIYARYDESVRGSDAFVIQSHTSPINEWLMEQLIMIDALKRASAKRITVVAPFYPYARQDKKGRGREPISARLVADLFKAAGADRIMSIDLHAAQIQGFFDGPVDHLFAMPVLLEHFQRIARPRDPHRRLARHGPRARRRHLERQARRAARDHPQATRPARAEPGLGARDRRRRQRPRLPARRRPHRHRPHHRQGRRGAEGERRDRRRRRRHARGVLEPRRRRSCSPTSSTASSSPTPCRSPTRSAGTGSRCCRSRRCSPAPSTRSSKTAR